MDLSGVFSIVALIVGIVLLLPLVVGGVFVVVVVANRADPDPSGRRPAIVYAFGTAFLTLFATLFATTAAVASLCRLIGSHSSSGGPVGFMGFGQQGGGGHLHPIGDAAARGAVLGAIVAIVAGLVFALHLRAASHAAAGARTVDPVGRVRSSYVAAVSFVAVAIAVVAAVVVFYDIFRGIAPGVFSASGQAGSVEVLRSLLPALWLALGALVILVAHLRHAPPPFRPGVFAGWFGGSSGPAGETAPPPPPVAPATPPTRSTVPAVEAPAPVAEVTPRKTTARKATPRKTPPRKTTDGG